MRKYEYVTQATENRVKKLVSLGLDEGKVLQWVLDEEKSLQGMYGASVTEAKKQGVRYHSDFILSYHPPRWYSAILSGWYCVYSEFTYYADTHGMNSWMIKDFNSLVRVVYDEIKEKWSYMFK